MNLVGACSDPSSPWLLAGVVIGLSLILAGFARLWFASRPLARIERRAARGDLAGAITALEARVHRRPVGWNWVRSIRARLDRADRTDEWTMLGVLEGVRGCWAVALAWFEQAATLDPADPTIRANQGHALIRLGQIDLGLVCVRAALADRSYRALDPLARSSLGLTLAELLLDVGRPEDACAALDDAAATIRHARWIGRRTHQQVQAEIATLRTRAGSGTPADLDARGDRD